MPADVADPSGGQQPRRGRRLGGWRRVAVVVAAVLGVVALSAITTAAALLYRGQAAVERVEVDGIAEPGGDEEGETAEQTVADTEDTTSPGEPGPDVEEITEVRHVLVVGSDRREHLTEEQRAEYSTGFAGGERTEAIMLARLDPRANTVGILSIPRDLLVTRCDGSRGRINAAYYIGERDGVGGASCLVQTVTDLTGIPVHHFVKIDFLGFVDIVDTLGGVTMFLDEALTDRRAGLDLPAGCVTLDGRDALAFVRARSIDNDFGRIARQQRFVRELASEMTELTTLVNVPRLFSLVDAVGRTVETDEDLTLDVIRRMAFSLRGTSVDDIVMRTVPGIPNESEGFYFLDAQPDIADELYERFLVGTLDRAPLGIQPLRAARTDDVPPFVVRNATGDPELGDVARDALSDAGFVVAAVREIDAEDGARTEVRYPPGREGEAELIAEQLDDARLVETAYGGRFAVVLGEDFGAEDLTTPPAGRLAQDDHRAAPAQDADDPAGAAGDPVDEPGAADDQGTDEDEDEDVYAGATPSDVEC